MKPAVSIIHGARRLGESPGYFPSWPDQLAFYLRQKGFEAEAYYWEGGVHRGLAKTQAEIYAAALRDMAKRYTKRPLAILGKSMGATIAELALRHLDATHDHTVMIDKLLRVACPDLRKVSIPNVRHVIDVRSSADHLFLAFMVPLSLITALQCRASGRNAHTYLKVRLSRLTHAELNENRPISDSPNSRLYDLYADLLSGNQPNIDQSS